MKITLTGIAFLLAAATQAQSQDQDHAHCPMAAHDDHRAAVDHRHDEVAGVSHAETTHHFRLAADGGSILLEVNDPSRTEDRDRVREHLRLVARSFAAGDFSMPQHIHGQVPPGVEAMTRMKADIAYAFSPTDGGGVVRLSSRAPAAVEAIHAFLRFQIEDHGTGDPVE